MSEENVNENGKHDLNFFLDKQLQQKLLEADELFLEKEYSTNNHFTSRKLKSNVTTLNVNSTSNQASVSKQSNNQGNHAGFNAQKLLRFLHSVHVCGWCPDPAVHYRKSENDAPPRSRAGGVIRESLFSRDSKSRPQNLNNFVFRHYADPRRYIEQYRREHACYDTTNSSAAKSEFLDSRRFYAYNQYSPLAVGSQGASLTQSNNYIPQPQHESQIQSSDSQQKSQQQQTPVLHYSNRREQQRQTISANLRTKNQHYYKLSKIPGQKSESSCTQDYTEEYIETLEINNYNKQSNSGSGKDRPTMGVNATSISKAGATKVNIPTGAVVGRTISQPSSGNLTEGNSSGHFYSHKLGHSGTGSRTLDSLSCVVSTPLDKQSQVRVTAEKESSNNTKQESVLSSRKKGSLTDKNLILPTAPISAFATTVVNSSGNANTNVETVTQSTCSTPNVNNNNHRLNKKDDNHLFNGATHALNGDKMEVYEESSDSSAVSIGCLSTKCLGIEATIKPRPKLEASCTYHVFPNEFTLNHHQGMAPSLLWNPSKSALERRFDKPNGVSLEFGMPGPFRQSPRIRPKTEESKNNRVVEFITKEFVADTKPINLCPDGYKETPRLNTAPGLKTNTIKPDLPSTFALQGISKRPHFEAFGKRKVISKTAMTRKKKETKGDKDRGRKSRSASTDTTSSHSATGNGMKLKPVTGDNGTGSNSNTPTTLAPVPYFKFWNSSLPPRSRERRRGGTDKMAELTMQQLAEMVLADENRQQDLELKEAAQKVLEQHSKSESEQQSAAGIATGDPWITPSINRIHQAELLESLCHVTQCSNQPKLAPLQLMSTQGDHTQGSARDRLMPQEQGKTKVKHKNDKHNISKKTPTPNNSINIDKVCIINKIEDVNKITEAQKTKTATDKGEVKQEKNKQNKVKRNLSSDGYVPRPEMSQEPDLTHTKVKSKSQDNINKQGHSKSPLNHFKDLDNSKIKTPHWKMKQFLDKSTPRHENTGKENYPNVSVDILPETLVEIQPVESELAGNASPLKGVFPKNHQHFLTIKNWETLNNCRGPSKGSVDLDSANNETKGEEKSLQELEEVNTGMTDLSPTNVEDFIFNLQTIGPAFPPLCGTGLGHSSFDRFKRKTSSPKKEHLSPLSDPDLDKLAKHMSVKVSISNVKYSKAKHMKRSQTIHL